MSKVILKQTVHPNLRWMIAYPLLLVSLLIVSLNPIHFYVIFFPIILIGYGFDFVFVTDKDAYVYYNIFGKAVFKRNKKFISPDYISVFKQAYVRENNFGFSPSIIGDDKYSLYTIKLFNEYERETVFESNTKEETLELGMKLANIFSIELHDTLN